MTTAAQIAQALEGNPDIRRLCLQGSVLCMLAVSKGETLLNLELCDLEALLGAIGDLFERIDDLARGD